MNNIRFIVYQGVFTDNVQMLLMKISIELSQLFI